MKIDLNIDEITVLYKALTGWKKPECYKVINGIPFDKIIDNLKEAFLTIAVSYLTTNDDDE